jgi:hypothetical protein
MLATVKARIAAGKLQVIEVQPAFARYGRDAWVSMAGRSACPALELFRGFVNLNFHD